MRALLVLPLLVAACADKRNDNELVRVVTEGQGDNCAYGGVAVETGVDANNDGILEDSEVTSTSYVCNASSAVTCSDASTLIHYGSVSLERADDFAALDGVTCIDGDLSITGFPDLRLPDLPDLRNVTGNVVVAANPQIQSLDGLIYLRKVGSGVLVEGNASLTSVSALAALDQFQSISIVANEVLADLSGFEGFGDLHTASVIVQSNPSMTSLRGLDSLTTIKTLVVHGNPALTSIDALGRLRNAAVLDISANVGLTSLALPQLQSLGVRLLINQNASLASVSLPALTSLSDALQFESNGALTSIDLPALVLTGSLLVQTDSSLTRVSAPKLTFATIDIVLNTVPALTTVDLSGLTTIGGQLQLWNLDSLPDLTGIPSLSSLGGDMIVISCNSLTDFHGLGAITSVPGNMTVSTNARLTSFTGLGAMTTVGGNLQITNNPSLSPSTAQMFASGITVHGTTTIQ